MGVFISHNIAGDQQDALSLQPETVNRLTKYNIQIQYIGTIEYTECIH